MELNIFIIALAAALALTAGTYRQYFLFLERLGRNVPRIWQNPLFRMLLWFTATVGSLIAAMVVYEIISVTSASWGWALFGAVVTLYARYFISAKRAHSFLSKTLVAEVAAQQHKNK